MRGLPARLFRPDCQGCPLEYRILLLFIAGSVHVCVGKLP